MPYRSTSFEAYKALEKLNEKQLEVLKVVKELGVCNDRQISERLYWPINRVTPRRGELVEMNKIVEVKRDKDHVSNRTVIYWKAIQTERQLELFQ